MNQPRELTTLKKSSKKLKIRIKILMNKLKNLKWYQVY